MVSKSNRKMMNERNRDEKQRFSIRKLSVGAASVLIGISFMTFGTSQVSADTVDTTQDQGNAPETDTKLKKQVSENKINSDQSQTEEGLKTETEDTNNEIVGTDESAVPTTDNSEVVSEEGTETTSNPEENKNVAGNTDQSENSDSADPTNTDFVVKEGNATPFNEQALMASLVEDNSTAVVKTADELTKALSDKNIKTIKVAGNITLNSSNFDNTRDVTIVGDKKADGSKYTIDFGDRYLNGGADQSVTYDNLNLRGQNYYGLIRNTGTSTFKDIDFEGSQMVFSGNDATINFEGTVTAKTVNKYKNLAGQEVNTKEANDTVDNPQQLLEFGSGHAGTINFRSGSNVTLGTVSGNVIQLAGADDKKNIINVEDGANVTLKPHTGTNVEGVGFANYHIANGIARGIYMKTKGTLNVAKGGTLNIVSGKGADDKLPSSGIYLSAGSEINNNGKLVVEASGDITPPQDVEENKTVAPIFIDGDATINDNGDFQVNAKDLGAYSGALININGQGHIKVGNTDPNSTAAKVKATFDVTSTGTSTGNVTGVQLGNGSEFKADQPTSFNIDLSNNNNAKAVRNGKIDFTGVKNEDSAPLGESFIQYDANGNVVNSKITAAAENTVNDVTANIKKNPNKVSFTAAGKQDVQVSDVHLEKQADGSYMLTGKVTPGSTADAPSYVNVKLDGKKLDVPNGPTQKVFTNDNGKTTSKDQASAAKVNEDGTFTAILPASMVENLKDTNRLQVSAVNSFVESSPVDKKPVASPSDVKVDDKGKVTGKAPAGSEVTVTLKDGTQIPVTAGENGTFEAQLTPDQFKEQAGKPVSVTATNGDGDTAIVDKEIVNKNDLKDKAADKDVNDTKATKEFTDADAAAQKAYTDAVDAAKKVISDPDATQAQVNEALKVVKDAKDGLKTSAEKLNAKKDQANKDIEAAAQKAKEAIEALPTLTQKEKDAAIADVNKHANAAKEAIKNATSADAAKADPTAINNDVKDAAKKDIDAAKTAKDAAIDKSNLTDEEKAKAKEATKTAADNAKKAVDNAKTEDGKNVDPAKVAEAAKTGKTNIDNVPETSAVKTKAKQDIADAAQKAKEAIDALPTLSKEEKDAAKAKVDTDAAAATTKVANATTDAAAKQAATDGSNTVNKDAAKTAIDDAAKKAKNDIEGNKHLTPKEVADAEKNVEANAKAAKEAIEAAKSNEAVKTATDNGTNNLNRDVAKAAIDDAKNAKDAKIDASNLTDEEKAAKKEETKKAAEAAKTAIDGATKPEDVTKEINTGKAAIEAVVIPETSDSKEAAKKNIDKAAEEAKTAIEGNKNLTDEEKAKAKAKVDADAEAAKTKVDEATTNDAVNKEAAKAAIQEALNTKLAEIENAKHLTPEEVTTFTNLAKNAAQAANANIDDAANADAVKGAKNDGLEAINGIEIPGVDVAKNAAKAAIAQTLADKTRDINNAPNLTDEEKKDLIKQVADIAAQADKDIDAATTDAAINDIATQGKQDITGVTIPTLDDAKKKANDDIDKAAEDAKKAIDALPTLTDEEKAAAKKDVDDHVVAAKKQVESAKNDADAQKAAKDGSDTVNKDAAKTAIDDAKKAKDAKIDASNLTDEEKAAKKKETKQAADDAKKAIDGAEKPEDVVKETNTGKDNIDKVAIPTNSKEKEDAKDAIDNKADDAKKAIDDNKNLTDEEKQAAKDDVDKHAQEAKDAIDNAKNNNDVKNATDEGNDKVNKDVAKAAVDDAKNAKDAAIDNSNLTDEEKATKKEETKKAADDAKKAIEGSKTPEDVDKNIEDGKKNINAVDIPEKSPVKEAAKDEVDKAADEAKNAIDNNKNLTDDQKKAARDNVDKKADEAKKNIDAAKKNADVDAAKNNGTTNVNRESAKAAVQDELNKKNNEIADSALTADEKKIKSDLAQQYAVDAFAAIDNAKDTQAVKDESTKGVNNINGIDIPTSSPAKDKANQAIDDALNKKNEEIDKAANLSDAEKQALKNDAKKIADDAKEAIKKATDDKGVAEVRDQAVLDIADVTVPSLDDAKNNAKDMIDKTLAEKTKEINAAKHLTDDEKADLLKKATKEAVNAKNNIDAANKNDDVKTAEENGVKAIEAVEVPSQKDVTDKAKDAIDQVSQAKKNSIDGAKNLSDAEKQALKDKVNAEADNAKKNIEAAGDDADAIKAAQDNGIDAIVDIEIPTLDSAKKNAEQAIDDALKSKTDEINKADNLTADEKAALIKKATDEANTAKNNIEAATTNDDAKAAGEEGVHKILGVKVPSLDEAKLAALKDIADALKTKLAEIENSDLSDAEKQVLSDQANGLAADARAAINKATNNEDAKKAAQEGVEKINAINVESASYDNNEGFIPDNNNNSKNSDSDKEKAAVAEAKNKALAALQDAKDAKLAEIDNSGLSASRKAALRRALAAEYDLAVGAVNAADSVAEVEAAAAAGVQAIEAIEVPSPNGNPAGSHAGNKGNGRETANGMNNGQSDKQLPQTGARNESATVLGAIAAGMAGVLALFGMSKKNKND